MCHTKIKNCTLYMHVYNEKYRKLKFRLCRWFGRTIYFLRMSQEKMNNQRISGKKFRFLNVWSFSYYRFPAFINYCFWCSSNATKSSKLSIIHVMQTSTVKTVCVYTKSSLWVSINETYICNDANGPLPIHCFKHTM